MSGNFKVHRILCSTPPDLEAEQTQFLDTLAQFAEEITMPDGVLFPAATFRAPFDALAQKHAVENNIRGCDFFLQIFGEQPAEPVYGEFVENAIQCAADPAQTMRQVAVLFKVAGASSEDMRSLRDALSPRCTVRSFGDLGELGRVLRDVLEAWYEAVRSRAAML
jgi:hypothetical protein